TMTHKPRRSKMRECPVWRCRDNTSCGRRLAALRFRVVSSCQSVCGLRSPIATPMIHVERLKKSFSDLRRGTVSALEHVSFDVQPGEIFGLLGPNGAGKTTCLRILSTVLRPTDGRATIAGYDVVTHPAEVRSCIGFMSGNTGVYDRMTAWELVEYYGRLYGMSDEKLQPRLEELFSTLQMHDFRDT